MADYFIGGSLHLAWGVAKTLNPTLRALSCEGVRNFNAMPRVGIYGSSGLGVGSVATTGAMAAALGWAGAAFGVYTAYAYEMNDYCSGKR